MIPGSIPACSDSGYSRSDSLLVTVVVVVVMVVLRGPGPGQPSDVPHQRLVVRPGGHLRHYSVQRPRGKVEGRIKN